MNNALRASLRRQRLSNMIARMGINPKPRMVNFSTRRIHKACLILCLLFASMGCESRSVVYTTPDGRTMEYRRTTLFGDSSTEGVSVSKSGDDLVVEVGSSGSTSNAEQMMGLILDLARAGARAGGVPVP